MKNRTNLGRVPGRPLLIGLLVAVAVSGCFRGPKDYEPPSSKAKIFLPSVRHAGPEPVYSRLRWVHPPEVLPARSIPGDDSDQTVPKIKPIYQINVDNSTLEELSRIIAATAQYTSYCAPSISKQKVSINNLGTIDELAAIIARDANITVVIDHPNREVRFFGSSPQDPELLNEY